MRVAMISMHTSPLEQPGQGDAGGMNVYVFSTALKLAELGTEVDIFTRVTRPSQGEVIEVAKNLRVINISAGPYDGLSKEDLPSQLATFLGGMFLFARRDDLHYDLLHSHYWLSGQVAWQLRDMWQIPFVHTAHTLAAVKNHYRSDTDRPEPEARRISEQQLVDNADRLIVNTEEESGELARHYDADLERVRVVAPGTDIDVFTPGTDRNTERSRRELGVPLHVKVIAFVGRLQDFKGPQVVIKALAQLIDDPEAPDVRLLLCGGSSGSGYVRSDFQALARNLGINHQVRFLHPRPREELVTVYQAADVVVVPSYNESFGLVALEAQATGTPVIAARVGGLPIAVADGQSGVLVDDHDPATWAKAMKDILVDDERRIAMGEQAVKQAAKFTWRATARRLLEVYESAADIDVSSCAHRSDRSIGWS